MICRFAEDNSKEKLSTQEKKIKNSALVTTMKTENSHQREQAEHDRKV